jgi:hypothetical protein
MKTPLTVRLAAAATSALICLMIFQSVALIGLPADAPMAIQMASAKVVMSSAH